MSETSTNEDSWDVGTFDMRMPELYKSTSYRSGTHLLNPKNGTLIRTSTWPMSTVNNYNKLLIYIVGMV